MKSSRVQGFTLIELLIVLTILGLLSAFAMSLYRDYVRRTHVGEGIQLATAARNALGETHGIYGYIYKNVAQGNNFAYALANPREFTGNAVYSITVGETYPNEIVIRYNEKLDLINYREVHMRAISEHGSLRWYCGVYEKNPLSVDIKDLPGNCRNVFDSTGFNQNLAWSGQLMDVPNYTAGP